MSMAGHQLDYSDILVNSATLTAMGGFLQTSASHYLWLKGCLWSLKLDVKVWLQLEVPNHSLQFLFAQPEMSLVDRQHEVLVVPKCWPYQCLVRIVTSIYTIPNRLIGDVPVCCPVVWMLNRNQIYTLCYLWSTMLLCDKSTYGFGTHHNRWLLRWNVINLQDGL